MIVLKFEKFLIEAYLLTEDRIEFLKKNSRDKILKTIEDNERYANHYHNNRQMTDPDKLIEFLSNVDPTSKKVYLQWILNQWFRDPWMTIEDRYRIKDELTTFERVKARMPGDQRDVNRFKTYNDLSNAIAPYEDTKSGKELKADEADQFKAQIDYLYRGPDGIIAIPKTQESSCFLGRGTKWCTAATGGGNYFNHYSKDGPLYVLIHKDGTKWQFHIESRSFMDERDQSITAAVISKSPLLPHLEKFAWANIKKNLLTWAMRTGSSNPEITKEIAKSAKHSYDYAKSIGKRFPLGEPAILTDKATAINYTADIIKGRWPELEHVLRNAPSFVKKGYEAAAKVH